MPAAPAAAAMRSKAAATSGRIPSPSGRRAGRCSRRRWPWSAAPPAAPSGAAASATADASTSSCSPPTSSRATTIASARTGAKESASGKRDPETRGSTPFALRRLDCGQPRPLQVGGLVEVGRVRLPVGRASGREQAGQVVAHRADGRDRRQVGRPLHPPFPVTAPATATSAMAPASRTKIRQEPGQRLPGLTSRSASTTLAIEGAPVARSSKQFRD